MLSMKKFVVNAVFRRHFHLVSRANNNLPNGVGFFSGYIYNTHSTHTPTHKQTYVQCKGNDIYSLRIIYQQYPGSKIHVPEETPHVAAAVTLLPLL